MLLRRCYGDITMGRCYVDVAMGRCHDYGGPPSKESNLFLNDIFTPTGISSKNFSLKVAKVS